MARIRCPQDQDMGSGQWWEGGACWHSQGTWRECGHGKWARASWADSWEEERTAAQGSGSEVEEPRAKSRRQEEADASASSRTAEAAAALPNAAADEANMAVAMARQQHADRLAMVITKAIDAGVQPLTPDGEELQVLDSKQLDALFAEHLQHDWQQLA